MSGILDSFLPRPDVRERHETVVHAPASLVLEVARTFDMESMPLVRAIFWLRERVMGARSAPAPRSRTTPERLLSMGWSLLAEEPGRCFVAGAACQPWKADVVFTAIEPPLFRTYSEADQVKIAWTLETEALAPAVTRFATETRAAATDEPARVRFRRYWRFARFGIVAIRLLLVPSIRRAAERRWGESTGGGAPGALG